MLAKEIVPLLLCRISKKLPRDPVETSDGDLYEKELLETELKRSRDSCFFAGRQDGLIYHRSERMKQIIEKVLASGEVDDQYVGAWAKKCLTNDVGSNLALSPNLLEASAEVSDVNSLEKEDITSIIHKAQAGNAEYMVIYGEHLLAGIDDTERDERKGYEWFERAAEKEYDLGVARMADCLLLGIGVEEDYNEAYERLIEHYDSVHCSLRLWYCHSKGILGFRKDEFKAEKILSRIKDMNLSQDNLRRMTMQVANLLNRDTHNVNVSGTTVKEEGIAPAPPLKNENTDVEPIPTEKTGDNTPIPLDDGDTVVTALNHGRDDISEITETSNAVKERHSTLKPMEGIPENSTSKDFDEGANTIHASTTALPSKKCSDCSIEKTQEHFSPSQWKKTRGTGRCISCVSGCPQWKTSNITSLQLQLKICCECKGEKKHTDFSSSQWKRPVGTGRCKDCVMNRPM